MAGSVRRNGLFTKSHFWQNWTPMQAQALAHRLGIWSRGRGPLRDQLAGALAQAIRQGTVPPGVRLPSERALAHALKISRTTVVAAYDELRARDWLESRRGSGTWVPAHSPAVLAARGSAQATALAESP